MRKVVCVAALGVALSACAGRDPLPVATVQPTDAMADCVMLRAEIEANNAKVKQLADEQGWKVAQNVAAGVGGLVVWPLFFAMDFKDAAGKDVAALQARQQYLAVLATQRCAQPAPPAPRVSAVAPSRKVAARPAPKPAPAQEAEEE